MKNNTELLKADIRGELAGIQELLDEFRELEIEGYRPAVISNELFLLLDDFRAFRHKFRHSYSFELDWEKEAIVARKLKDAYKMFKDQIDSFLRKIDEIE